MRWQDQSGSVLVDVVAASALLLIVVLSTMTWSNQLNASQVDLRQSSSAQYVARLLLEQQVSQALVNSTTYASQVAGTPQLSGALSALPALAGSATGLANGQYTLTRTIRHPTGSGPQPIGSVSIFDLTAKVTWSRLGGSTGQVVLTKSIFQR